MEWTTSIPMHQYAPEPLTERLGARAYKASATSVKQTHQQLICKVIPTRYYVPHQLAGQMEEDVYLWPPPGYDLPLDVYKQKQCWKVETNLCGCKQVNYTTMVTCNTPLS